MCCRLTSFTRGETRRAQKLILCARAHSFCTRTQLTLTLPHFFAGNALFFNLRFFENLHWSKGTWRTCEARAYWYMTMCHELAHAFTPMHDETHGFYTSSFAESYFHSFARVLLGEGLLP